MGRSKDDPQTQTQEPRAATRGRDAERVLLVRRVFPERAEPALTWLKLGERVSLGRENATVIVDDHRASRTHCELSFSRAGCSVLDLESKNGTWLEGRRLSPRVETPMPDGSLLRLGDTLFVTRSVEHQGPDPEDSEDPLLPGRAPGVVTARWELRELRAERDPVLIIGESGTGKELAARILHRPGTPIVPVNCSELSPSIARAELFGTERGAFTDAAARGGLIAAAGDGLLFLDEIGELDLGVQAELLRFLEDGHYRRVGGSELIESGARVVAATNVNLEVAAREGRFRRDLLARLRRAARAIVLPPLRERREDLLDWSRRFLDKHGLLRKMTAGFVERLLLHTWPENLRELESVLRSAARRGTDQLEEAHLDKLLDTSNELEDLADEAGSAPASADPASSDSALEVDREVLISALRATRGNLKRAADRLNIERTKLYRAIKKLGIDVNIYRDEGG